MIDLMQCQAIRHKAFCKTLWVMILGISLCLIGGATEAQSPQQDDPVYRTGALPFTPDIQKRMATGVIPVKERRKPSATLPTHFKNWRHLPVVRSQQINNCGAFSPSYYYKTYQEARENGWLAPDTTVNPERVMSPGFTYPLSNNGKDEGANVYIVLETISNHGIAPWSVMPETLNYLNYPNEAAWRAAIPYRGRDILSFDTKTLAGQDALKEHLASGDPAVMSALLYHDTFDRYGVPGWGVGVDSEVIYGPGTNLWDWHAFTVIGYDDDKAYTANGQPKKGAFLVVNSWGPGWGVQDADVGSGGFAWFAYDYLLNPPGGSMAGPIMAVEDRIAYQPVDLAVYDVSIALRKNLNMSIYAGSPDNKLSEYIIAFPNGGGEQPFGGRIVVDISDLGAFGPVCYSLSALDISNYAGVTLGSPTGAITHFHIEKADGSRIGCPVAKDNPCQLAAGVATHVSAGPLHIASIGLDDFTTQCLSIAPCDWDNDGRPDLGVGGGGLSNSKLLRFYWNTGQGVGQQTDVTSGTTLLNLTALAWGDYDNDGLADLAASGFLGYDGCTRLYRNRGPAGFVDSEVALPALKFASLAWGDYNNDGRLDLAMAGKDDQSNDLTRIYRNEGGGQLIDSGIALDPKSRVGVSWADMNNDGWLDLAVGATLYQNNGDETFTARLTLEDAVDNRQAWGDYDGDGLLDLAYMGYLNEWQASGDQFHAAIYHNQGNFDFVDINAGLHPVYNGSLAWADFDNDGRLDLALCGFEEQGWEDMATRLYRQAATGQFADMGADLTPVATGTLTWADFDSDGALDLLLSGSTPPPSDAIRFQGATSFYHSRVALTDEINRPNQPPSIPEDLRADWDDNANALTLMWNPATDRETTRSLSLGYRVRMGTWSGGSDVVSPAADLNLYGPHPHCLLADGQPGRRLLNLPTGRYFWSVQAIDGGLASGAWSHEKIIVLGSQGLISGDINEDGRIDVADVVLIVEMAAGRQEARLEVADLDGNGQVQSLDVRELLNRLLSKDPGEYMKVLESTLFSGGTISSPDYGIELEAPAGSLSAPKAVSFEVSSTDLSYGPGTEPIAWRVRGLPIDNTGALKLRVRDLRADTSGTPFLAIGGECFAKSLGEMTTAYRIVEGRSLDGGWIEIDLPELGALTDEELQSLNGKPLKANDNSNGLTAVTTLVNYDFWFVIHLLADSQWKYKGGNFSVIGPLDKKSDLPLLAADLEEALTYYRDTIGFDVSRRNWTKYPLEVTLSDLGGRLSAAGYTYPGLGYNSISIELNKELLAEREVIRLAAVHELFHVIQHLMDKRNRFSRLVSAPNLWLDEATAVYMESHFAKDLDYIPGILKAYKTASFGGYWQAEKFFGSTSQNYGYGMVPLISHLVNRNGGDPVIILRMYQKIQVGIKGIHALQQCAPGYPLDTWLTSYYKEIVRESIYPGLITLINMRQDVATKKRIVTMKGALGGLRLPEEALYPLSAGLSFIQFDKALPVPDDKDNLGFLLRTQKPSDYNLEALAMTRTGGATQVASLGNASLTSTENGLKLVVPDASQYTKSDVWLVPVVTNVKDTLPYDDPSTSTLHFGIIRDYPNHIITEHNTGPATVWSGIDNLGWPTFTGQGTFTALDVTRLVEGYKTPGNAIPGINIHLWGDPLQPIVIDYSATVDSSSFSGVVGDYMINCSLLGDLSYRMRKWSYTRVGDFNLSNELVYEGPWQETGNFTLSLDEDEEMCSFGIELQYGYHMNRVVIDTGQLISDEDHIRSGSTAFSIFALRE